MTCRDEILECARRIVHQTGRNQFSLQNILDCMQLRGTGYDVDTIRLHVTSIMCANCPDTDGTTYEDFEQTADGLYRLRMP